jgi:hypothetical protein
MVCFNGKYVWSAPIKRVWMVCSSKAYGSSALLEIMDNLFQWRLSALMESMDGLL